eukprot:907636-Rhodomonas_salina.1
MISHLLFFRPLRPSLLEYLVFRFLKAVISELFVELEVYCKETELNSTETTTKQRSAAKHLSKRLHSELFLELFQLLLRLGFGQILRMGTRHVSVAPCTAEPTPNACTRRSIQLARGPALLASDSGAWPILKRVFRTGKREGGGRGTCFICCILIHSDACPPHIALSTPRASLADT